MVGPEPIDIFGVRAKWCNLLLNLTNTVHPFF